MLRYSVAVLLGTKTDDSPIHTQITKAYEASENAKHLIRAALVLSADHELNTSAFAARCAASTRAPLHAALVSGLGAFTGPRHGAASGRVSAWVAGLDADTDVEGLVSDCLSRGEALPGFGHSIYGDRDPRADGLLSALMEREPDHPFRAQAAGIPGCRRRILCVAPEYRFRLGHDPENLSVAERRRKGDLLFRPYCRLDCPCAGAICGARANPAPRHLYRAKPGVRPSVCLTDQSFDFIKDSNFTGLSDRSKHPKAPPSFMSSAAAVKAL